MFRNICLIGSLAIWLVSCLVPEKDTTAGLRELFNRTPDRIPMISAHRGGSYPNWPENCLQTFEFVTKQSPMLIECDVREAADGTLILMHDKTVDRTTNGGGAVAAMDWEYLSGLRLVDHHGKLTEYRIPTLKQALEWARGRTVLTLDVKDISSFESTVNMIHREAAKDYVVMITYTLKAAEKIYNLDPNLMLSVTVRNLNEYKQLERSSVPMDQVIAFTGTALAPIDLYQSLHRQGVYCILGTLGNLDQQASARGDKIYTGFIEQGVDIIATNRPLEVARVLSKQWNLEPVLVNEY